MSALEHLVEERGIEAHVVLSGNTAYLAIRHSGQPLLTDGAVLVPLDWEQVKDIVPPQSSKVLLVMRPLE